MLAISIQTKQTQSVCVRLFCSFSIAGYAYEMRLRSVEIAFRGTNFSCIRQKPGTPVYCPLPPFVIEALNAIPESTYFFWTGLSTPKTAAGIWQESLKRLFVLAGVPDGHAHRFQDTFSVELLLAGVPIERVSILLGHQSVRITEKHYAPWVRALQEQWEADVRRTWETPEPQRRVHGGYTKK